jgi:hypothetical protein
MSAQVYFHQVITPELMLKAGIQFSDYEFGYDSDGNSRLLIAESIAGQEHQFAQLYLKDHSGAWNPEEFNLAFTRNIYIPHLTWLFGKDGVAGENAEIGTAVIWASKQSNQRGVFVGESFTAYSEKNFFEVCGEFPAGILRDRVHLQTILYLKSAGQSGEAEQHFAKKPGTILGHLSETVIHFNGNASLFPIFTMAENGPLWRAECNWGDPRIDPFDEEYVRIVINESHKDYKYIAESDQGLSPLMREIVASALQIIIEKVLEEVPLNDLDGSETEPGSICIAVNYFIRTFSLDVSSKEMLAIGIRRHLDRIAGGIA